MTGAPRISTLVFLRVTELLVTTRYIIRHLVLLV